MRSSRWHQTQGGRALQTAFTKQRAVAVRVKPSSYLRRASTPFGGMRHRSEPTAVRGTLSRPVACAKLSRMFLPNQKVVCVDGKFPLGIEQLYSELPKEGTTYTIRDIVPGVGLTGEEGETAVYLCEITGPLNAHGIERGFPRGSLRATETIEEEAEEEISLGMPGLVPA